MRFSQALPTCALKTLSPLHDYDFALAQLVLRDPDYAEFYRQQKASGRFVLMDNGFHETGKSLSIPELIEAAKLIMPSVLIAPDELGKPLWTLEQYQQMRKSLMSASLPNKIGVAAVLQGSDFKERGDFFMSIRDTADMLCFPFRAPRFEWMYELLERIPSHTSWPPRIHLLGVKTFQELRDWRTLILKQKGLEGRVTVDTTKPFKYGMKNVKLDDSEKQKETLRGFGGWPAEDVTGVTPAQYATTYYNLAYMRKFL